MPRIHEKYYGLEGGLSYKTFLKHFEEQAKGSGNLKFIKDMNTAKTDGRFRKPNMNSSLILVDIADDNNINAKNEKQPSVQVIDPTESARRIAEDRAATESSRSYKSQPSSRKNHSNPSRQGRKNTSASGNKRKASAPGKFTSTRSVKRARDIFED